MCLGNHIDHSRFDRIGNDPMKDLFDLIDVEYSPVNSNCKYVEPQDVKIELKNIKGSQFCVLHCNIHSIPSKLTELNSLLFKLRDSKIFVDVILLCETFITDENKGKCQIDGYELFDEHRQNITRGGVAIYVSKKLQYKERKDLNIFVEGKFESCFIEVTLRSKPLVIGEIYRVPGTREVDFISTYEEVIGKIHKEKKSLIIGTDQNLDFLKIHEHTNTAKFLDVNLSNGILPTITKPT